ncbi:hypothetical protein [Actinocorallia herbida]|nr:hypothetical protein [Actinocorallia herbida]
MSEHSGTAEEVTAVLALARRDGIRNLVAWMSTPAGQEDFPRRLAELRARPLVRERPSCGHRDSVDPVGGGCLLCGIKTARAQPSPSVAADHDADDAAGRALLEQYLARGRTERERKNQQSSARTRRPSALGEVLAFSPEVWQEREASLAAEDGCRPLPYTDPAAQCEGQETA